MLRTLCNFLMLSLLLPTVVVAATLNLDTASVLPVGDTGRAVEVLVEEIDARAQILLPHVTALSSKGATIVIGTRDAIRQKFPAESAKLPAASAGAEGYSLAVGGSSEAPLVLVAGNDKLGTLFGVGRLLQSMRLTRNSIRLSDALSISTAPRYSLRGHQLGYRPKTNSYDGWDVHQWDKYIRELALFGTNAIELITPRSDDASDSPHFPKPPHRMMSEMSRIADSYGMQCWVWFPALEKDYTDPASIANAVREWEEVFRELPRVDAIFVPGGDPGHTEPKILMDVLKRQADVLRKFHPKATLWVSPQGFDESWMEEFYGLVNQNPTWLGGIVYGPQNRESLQELRRRLPKQYPIRHYPDITHTIRAQFPVPDWDVAYALTLQREPINPRPLDQAAIFRKIQPGAEVGFLTYSEGCNDDVNKFVWSALGWDPDANVTDLLRAYSRLFIGPELSEGFAQGLLRLEQNWRGPLIANEGVNETLAQFHELELRSTPQQKANWRFQQALYRAYYDAYTRVRLLDERAREQRAMEDLRQAPRLGALNAVDAAEKDLRIIDSERAGQDLRARVFELAEALFQSIRMQLSVPRYQAISVGRGANLDLIDTPLNDAPWLRVQFDAIRKETSEAERIRRIDSILNWTNPGPGGFYDNLGDLTNEHHVLRSGTYAEDPNFSKSVLTGFSGFRANREGRMSWWTVAETLGDTPLEMRYTDLDPAAKYRVRVIYGGDADRKTIRMVADGSHEIHPFRIKNQDFVPLEFDIPKEATADGVLTLQFSKPKGLGGNGRGVQVSEVWLLRSEQ